MMKLWMNKVRCAAVLLVLINLCGFAQAAGNHHDVEHQLKAAFLYKFAAYIEWPAVAFAQAEDPLMIGVVGSEEMAAELTKLNNGIRVNNRAVHVKSLSTADNINDLHILFISHRAVDNLPALLNQVRDKPVLAVTESPGALDAGSIINFIPVDSYIRFEISVTSAEASGIKISARLLDVAQRIEKRSSQ
jgi:hypothetical protein